MLKVAFIGAGRMANAHAAQLQKIENVEIAGVYDIDPEKSRIFAERYRIPKQYASQEELLGDRSLNGILMCHYCPDHAASMMAAMPVYLFREARDPQDGGGTGASQGGGAARGEDYDRASPET